MLHWLSTDMFHQHVQMVPQTACSRSHNAGQKNHVIPGYYRSYQHYVNKTFL